MLYSLYFHIPFCVHRCAYCDFNTYAGQQNHLPAYVDALGREIKFVAARLPRSALSRAAGGDGVHTLFFGGGTPSLLTAQQFAQILQTVRRSFPLLSSDALEISLEANPGTLTPEYLRELRALSFNRISLGVQSAHPDELRQLERIHDFYDVIESVKWIRQAGFDNLNLDLIFGLPEQTLARWQATVERLVDLAPEHLSLYALTVEQGTPYGRWAARGLLPMPDPDLAADMYEWAGEYLDKQGYEQYEISNWAKKKDAGRIRKDELGFDSAFRIRPSSFQCLHNLQYWRNQPYLGFGAGAHGYAAGMRYSNVLHIKTYIERLTPPCSLRPALFFPLSPAAVHHEQISRRAAMQETMLTGLRLTQEGVSEAAFRERFGVELREVFGKEIDELVGLKLLEWLLTDSVADSRMGTDLLTDSITDKRMGTDLLTDLESDKRMNVDRVLRLTKRGRLLGNQVFMRFVGE